MKELEQRVKALEYEIKILKNEIQRTLLDIQEQVLVHYYPALRSDSDALSERTVQTFERIREQKGVAGGDSGRDQPTERPRIKEVSIDEARSQQPAANPDEGRSEGRAQSSEQDEMVILSGWVSSTAQRIGKDPTATLVRTYIGEDILSPHLEQPLLRLTGLMDQSDAPENVAVNDILRAVMKLNELLGRDSDIDDALSIIEKAQLG